MEQLNNQLSISTVGSILMGAGIARLDNIELALTLIGIGAGLKVIVAILQKFGVPVTANRG